MKTTIKILICLLAVLPFAACTKEYNGGLRLMAENRGGAKMSINGGHSSWATGDIVWINGEECPVTVDENTGEGTADVTASAPFHGVYPATLLPANTPMNTLGTTYTLNLPAEYDYTTVDGRQNLESPMVAYAADGQTLLFKHLTAAINVQVKNYHYDYPIAVDQITISSNNFQLCGEKVIDITDVESLIPGEGNANNNTVTMNFSNSTPLVIPTGGDAVVQIPVLPVGNTNKFTIKVSVHRADQPVATATSATLSRAQSAMHSLDRAKMGYALFTLGGPFTVNANNKKVIFSKGNLQWSYDNGATHTVNGGGTASGTWRFAEHQYDIIGADNANIAANYSGWIDLFGYGTSGYSNKYPYLSSTNINDYCGNINIANTNYDWGQYNAISNGGNEPNLWRTCTESEFEYIFSKRSTSLCGLDSARYAKATVNNIKGIIFFNDGYTHPDGITLPDKLNIKDAGFDANGYSDDDWGKMELSGAIFLPCAGFRSQYPNYSNTFATYWTSISSGPKNAQYFIASTTNVGIAYVGQSRGQAVRLVQDVN